MSVEGDSLESAGIFYSAQFISDGRRQAANARYIASHHRQARTLRQIGPSPYGATQAPQHTESSVSCRGSRMPGYELPPTWPLLSNRRDEAVCCTLFMYFCAAAGFVICLVLFIYTPRNPSVPMRPDELERYRRSGIYWGSPWPVACGVAYHFREYVAELHNVSLIENFDMIRACQVMPIQILDQTFETPDQCRRRGMQMYGHWTVYDPNDCTIEDEMQKYRNSGMYWDDPQPGQHCQSYDKREYEAHLQAIPAGYDRIKACNYMPITIHDQVIEKPDLCELRHNEMYGKWFASGQLDCKPYWGPLKDVGCQASRKKRYEAPLWNLIEGDDWYTMCKSTPATWNGRFYEHPTTCDYRKHGGMTGIWESDSC